MSGGSTGCASEFGEAAPAPRLAELADIYGGAALSICDPDWGRDLAAHLLGGPDTWAPTRLFSSEEPVEGTLEAVVDGERWPSVDEEGLTRWKYEAGRNAVSIWERARPESGSTVVVRYVPRC
ncbi:MAG TPA: hypothetical protein RMG48_01395 [Myxococcales bacterium LLY-WYZ-16_1]|nr:hypothetical protein [Myxococcales bacterium LLY-WYZ-16_1]